MQFQNLSVVVEPLYRSQQHLKVFSCQYFNLFKVPRLLNLQNHSIKMKIKPSIHLISAIILAYIHTRVPVLCNPIAFDPSTTPLMALGPMPLQAPMMMGPQYDPYGAMASNQYMYAQPQFLPMPPFETHRRSNSGLNRSGGRGNSKPPQEMTDEQKALADLPVSFVSKLAKRVVLQTPFPV